MSEYAKRDLEALDAAGRHYCRHVSAMTTERLERKSAIAAELGWRDMRIAELEATLAERTKERDEAQAASARAREAYRGLLEQHEHLKREETRLQFNARTLEATLAERDRRVAELEAERKRQALEGRSDGKRIARLEEALGFYADEKNHEVQPCGPRSPGGKWSIPVGVDAGERARQALDDKKGGA